jgi:hypothetical protein
MKRFSMRGTTGRRQVARFLLIGSVLGLLSAGCTRLELEDKASAYNAAIGESNNRQILLNAVRASHRAPMSFVGFGDMAAQPNFSGSVSGSWEFDPFGLTKTTAGSSLNTTGGFTNFQISNLNSSQFLTQIQKPIPQKVIQHFIDLNYPPELLELVFVQQYVLTRGQYNAIESSVDSRCAQAVGLDIEICSRIAEDQAAYRARCPQPIERGPTTTIHNNARDFCAMKRFQMFVRQLKLMKGIAVKAIPRTTEGMLYWLGQLIAAQNYSVHPYLPEIFILTADGHMHTVPLFEVRRGPPPLLPAVLVTFHGEIYYIPQPELGTIEEARSLQVLDLVWYAMALATSKDDLPKSTTVTLVNAR